MPSDTIKNVAEAIDWLGDTHRREDYILVVGWVRALKPADYFEVKWQLVCMKSINGIRLLIRAFKHL
jgi:hypothetical protein